MSGAKSAKCPHCGAEVKISVTHGGKSTNGSYERTVIEAVHTAAAEGAEPCAAWHAGGAQHDLVALAASVPAE